MRRGAHIFGRYRTWLAAPESRISNDRVELGVHLAQACWFSSLQKLVMILALQMSVFEEAGGLRFGLNVDLKKETLRDSSGDADGANVRGDAEAADVDMFSFINGAARPTVT